MKKIFSLFVSLMAFFSVNVFAATPTSAAELASAVDFADLKSGAMAIFALLIAVAITMKAGQFIYHLVKR